MKLLKNYHIINNHLMNTTYNNVSKFYYHYHLKSINYNYSVQFQF